MHGQKTRRRGIARDHYRQVVRAVPRGRAVDRARDGHRAGFREPASRLRLLRHGRASGKAVERGFVRRRHEAARRRARLAVGRVGRADGRAVDGHVRASRERVLLARDGFRVRRRRAGRGPREGLGLASRSRCDGCARRRRVGLALYGLQRGSVDLCGERVALKLQAASREVRVATAAAALGASAAAGLGARLAADLVFVRGHAAGHLHDLLHDSGRHRAPVRVVAGGNHVAHVHVYVVVRVDLNAALGLVLLELLLALFLQLVRVGVAVVVEGANLVDAEERLRVRHVASLVGIEVDYRAVFKLARASANQVVDAAVNRGQREVEQV